MTETSSSSAATATVRSKISKTQKNATRNLPIAPRTLLNKSRNMRYSTPNAELAQKTGTVLLARERKEVGQGVGAS